MKYSVTLLKWGTLCIFWRFVNAAGYFDAIADALEGAKEEIFITAWWYRIESESCIYHFKFRNCLFGTHWCVSDYSFCVLLQFIWWQCDFLQEWTLSIKMFCNIRIYNTGKAHHFFCNKKSLYLNNIFFFTKQISYILVNCTPSVQNCFKRMRNNSLFTTIHNFWPVAVAYQVRSGPVCKNF